MLLLAVCGQAPDVPTAAPTTLPEPIDYRLCIEQRDGAWKLLWLIAGD